MKGTLLPFSGSRLSPSPPDGLSRPSQPLCMPACGDMCEQHHVYSLKGVTPRSSCRSGPEQVSAGVGGGGAGVGDGGAGVGGGGGGPSGSPTKERKGQTVRAGISRK